VAQPAGVDAAQRVTRAVLGGVAVGNSWAAGWHCGRVRSSGRVRIGPRRFVGFSAVSVCTGGQRAVGGGPRAGERRRRGRRSASAGLDAPCDLSR
jgi:hypothetical protein